MTKEIAHKGKEDYEKQQKVLEGKCMEQRETQALRDAETQERLRARQSESVSPTPNNSMAYPYLFCIVVHRHRCRCRSFLYLRHIIPSRAPRGTLGLWAMPMGIPVHSSDVCCSSYVRHIIPFLRTWESLEGHARGMAAADVVGALRILKYAEKITGLVKENK